ncbi:MAG: hypothetical protein M1836_006550 [Candelina mexicana]|nr:MAG: hypothetical protein M1836_006550 [Candelina mexicana]
MSEVLHGLSLSGNRISEDFIVVGSLLSHPEAKLGTHIARSLQRPTRPTMIPLLYMVDTNSEEQSANGISPRKENPGPPTLLDGGDASLDIPRIINSTALSKNGINAGYILPVVFFVAFFVIFLVAISLLAFALSRRASNKRRHSTPTIYELQQGTGQEDRSSPRYERLEDFILGGGAVGAQKRNDAEALRKEAARRAQALRKGPTPKTSRPPSRAPSILATTPRATRTVASFERLSSMDSDLSLPPPIYKADDPLKQPGSDHRPEKLPSY